MNATRKYQDMPGQNVLPFFAAMQVVEPDAVKPPKSAARKVLGGLPVNFEVPEHGLDGDAFLRREDGTIVKDKAGKPIKRWGTTKQARKLLSIEDKETLYVLIHAKLIVAYKLNTTAKSKNGRFRVDLQSVMAHKLKQM